jgi:N utilization substance protein B
MLYQWDLTREPMERLAELFWRVRTATDQAPLAAPTREAAERLARGAQAELARIDEAIAGAGAHWRFERLAAVDRNILRLGVYELLFTPDTPPEVILDEAVQIAKRFGEADSPAFVNGVLDAVRQKVRPPVEVSPVKGAPGA